MNMQFSVKPRVLLFAQALLCVVVVGVVEGCAVQASQKTEDETESMLHNCAQRPIVAIVSTERDITFYPDGVTQIREGYSNSTGGFVAHGSAVWVNPDRASIRAIGLFQDGTQKGAFFVYFKSGHIEMASHYENGLLSGASTAYYANGHVRCIQCYLNGVANGWFGRWYENQILGEEGIFVAGKKHGRWMNYWSNGTQATQEEYASGELLHRNTWDRQGRLVTE